MHVISGADSLAGTHTCVQVGMYRVAVSGATAFYSDIGSKQRPSVCPPLPNRSIMRQRYGHIGIKSVITGALISHGFDTDIYMNHVCFFLFIRLKSIFNVIVPAE